MSQPWTHSLHPTQSVKHANDTERGAEEGEIAAGHQHARSAKYPRLAARRLALPSRTVERARAWRPTHPSSPPTSLADRVEGNSRQNPHDDDMMEDPTEGTSLHGAQYYKLQDNVEKSRPHPYNPPHPSNRHRRHAGLSCQTYKDISHVDGRGRLPMADIPAWQRPTKDTTYGPMGKSRPQEQSTESSAFRESSSVSMQRSRSGILELVPPSHSLHLLRVN
ncbi:hypothetical protein BDZ89DRAFT_1129730 [Hymenopellis radicata]|nr:hypothetical protein BDZ89DRAFT_1129730 [Hymenopellis radicata]